MRMISQTLVLTFFGWLWIFSTAFAAQEDLAERQKRYDCEKKAVEYAYNLDKAGDTELIEKHVRDCMAVTSLKAPAAKTLCSDAATHPVVFVNNSKQDIFVGIWQGEGRDGGGNTGFSAPADFPDWKLPTGETRTWCAPKGFNGRVFPRTGCRDTKNCDVGNCCEKGDDTCKGYRCTTGNQPASAVEFNDDDNRLNYDVSYVDGYNFPILLTPIDATGTDVKTSGKCQVAGCTAITPCPWSGSVPVGGVCLAPYKLFQNQHSDYSKLQQFYILAAKCVDDAACGCGNQCKLNPENNPQAGRRACPNTGTVDGITIQSAGCSTVAYKAGVYDRAGKKDPDAKNQTVCDPTSDNPTDCNPNLKWETFYQKYPRTVSCNNSYFWQYHDDSGNLSCLDSTGAKGFRIEFGPLADGLSVGGVSFTVAPGFAKGNDPVSGTVVHTSGNIPKSYKFTGPTPLQLNLNTGDQLAFTLECRRQSDMGKTGKSLTCVTTFDEKTGLSTTDDACKKSFDSGLNFMNNTLLTISATNEDFIKNDNFKNQCK